MTDQVTADLVHLVNLNKILDEAIEELQRAKDMYPEWPVDIVHATSIMVEESTEALKSANEWRWSQKDGTLADVRKETIQTIAMCFRLLLDTPALVEETA